MDPVPAAKVYLVGWGATLTTHQEPPGTPLVNAHKTPFLRLLDELSHQIHAHRLYCQTIVVFQHIPNWILVQELA